MKLSSFVKYLTLCILYTSNLLAQNKKDFTVGDTIPNLYIPVIINSDVKSASLHDFKDKLLILDFGSSRCGPCIAALPKLDSLQKKYGDKIKILPITYEKEKIALEFYKSNIYAKNTELPSVVEDTILHQNFKHYAEPYEVWIYNGVIIALTDEDYVSDKNIKYILGGNSPQWPVLSDFTLYNKREGIFFKNNLDMSTKGYSVLTGFKNGLYFPEVIGSILDSVNKIRRNYIVNNNIINSYVFMWNKVIHKDIFDKNRVIYNVKDRKRYRYDLSCGYKREWKEKNEIFYESKFNDGCGKDSTAYLYMIKDLDKLLDIMELQ